MTAGDLVMAQDTHRTPDGQRRLLIGRVGLALLSCVTTGKPIECHHHRHAERAGETVHPHCQQTILPGRFFLLHRIRRPGDTVDRLRFAYCAPCAVREYGHWGVREADDDGVDG